MTDLHALARHIWDSANPDAPARTVGCPHPVRFCPDCEERIDRHVARLPMEGAEQ